MKKIYSLLTLLLLMIGSGKAWAQAVVTSTAPVKNASWFTNGSQILLKNLTVNKYVYANTTNNMMMIASHDDLTTLTADYILTVEGDATSFKFKQAASYLQYAQNNKFVLVSTADEATSFSLHADNSGEQGKWDIKVSLTDGDTWLNVENGESKINQWNDQGDPNAVWEISLVNPEFATVTYNVSFDGSNSTSVEKSCLVGGYYPAIADFIPTPVPTDWYTVTGIPTGTVPASPEAVDVSINYTDAFPFTPSANAGEGVAWCSLTLNGKFLNKGTDESISLQNQNTFRFEEAQLWCFVGNIIDGFQIYNREKGDAYVLASVDVPSNNDTQATTHPVLKELAENPSNARWNVSKSTHQTNGFFLNVQGQSSWKINDRNDKVAFWTGGADAGSTFVVATPEEHFEENSIYSACKAKVDAGLLTEDKDIFGFPAYTAFIAAKNVLEGEHTLAELGTALTTLTTSTPAFADGYYYLESKATSGSNSFPTSPNLPAIYDDVDNEYNTYGRVLVNNGTRTTKYIWKVTFDGANKKITLKNSRGLSPVVATTTKAETDFDYASILDEYSLHLDYFHATNQTHYTLRNTTYDTNENPAYLVHHPGDGIGNDYHFVSIQEQTIYTVGTITFPEGVEEFECTVSYSGEGYAGYAEVPVGGFFAINTASVDESKFTVNTPEGYTATVTIADDTDGNKIINTTVAEMANVAHYTLHVTYPHNITPSITYNGEAHDGEVTVYEDGAQFAFKENVTPLENEFTINDGEALKWYTRSFVLDTENHTITLTYSPRMPEAGKTYRLRDVTGSKYIYAYSDDSNVYGNYPFHVAADKSSIDDEKKLFFTIEDDGDGDNTTYYMKNAYTGKYMTGHKATSENAAKIYLDSPHSTLNGFQLTGHAPGADGGRWYFVTWSGDVLEGWYANDSRGAWLFEEVQTYDLTLNPAANGFATLYLPFDAIIPEGLDEVKYPTATGTAVEGKDGYYYLAWSADITDRLAKETGVLVRGTAGTTYRFYETERTATAAEGNVMTGVFDEDTPGLYSYYSLGRGTSGTLGFYLYAGEHLLPYRAYIATSAFNGNVKGFLFEDGSLTGIEAVEAENAAPEYYDLMGRRVLNPTKGIYLMNGKKVIINK